MDPSTRLRALLFDLDGVLVDVSRSYRRAIEETTYHFTGRNILPGTIQRYKNAGGFNDDWKLTHAIISDIGMQVSFSRVVEEFQRRYLGDNWNGFITEETPLIETHTLEALAGTGRVLGIVTGRPEAEATWTINRFGWRRYFPLLVPMEKQEGRGKPDPFPLQFALAMLDAAGRRIQPEESVYIGDSVDDMVAARAAGLWAIGVVPPYLDREAHAAVLYERGAHVVIDDLARLPSLIETFEERVAAGAAARKTA
ncbi:HAD hydrolase-like protein [Rhodocaloribacter litoris]|uniref:HAD family hydrolase n=1 Tax=Rhodocaloribacter litoris TaxID=2558931 RepID=UPI001420DE97|nr:HAD hydrolase-like protein [Rhodocaloribacter litoris]QXD13862.1 HAD hydrolase-like protein [Rhodocaloribacter litoris]GIV60298.1 MAG: haloacid dehalogenase [Rhodothermaceae bacterium]